MNSLKWDTFCQVWAWIAQINALAALNKYLIDDLARSEELLEKAQKRLRNVR